MYSNFDEIIQNMITPETNSEEFLKLLLTSEMDPVKGKLMLTKNFNYDLNSNHSEDLSFFVNNVKRLLHYAVKFDILKTLIYY